MEEIKPRPVASATTAEYDEGLRRYFSNVFFVMTFGLLITGLASELVIHSPAMLSLFVTKDASGESLTWLWYGLAFGELGIVGWLAVRMTDASMTIGSGLTLFALYAAANGLTLAPVLSLYTGASVLKVFFITAATFSACAIYGHTTKRDLTALGAFLMVGLFGLIIAMVVNIFMHSSAMDFVISIAGVLIFAGLTAWDMQKLRLMYDAGGASNGLVVGGALTLYLDFLNMFLMLLRLLGYRSSDD